MKLTLKGIRNNLDLTQEEMAKRLNVSKKTYQKYEDYTAYPNIKAVKEILKMSNADFNDVIFLPEDYAESEK